MTRLKKTIAEMLCNIYPEVFGWRHLSPSSDRGDGWRKREGEIQTDKHTQTSQK